MAVKPAPLFWIAVSFAAGCGLGLTDQAPWWEWLVFWVVALGAWAALFFCEKKTGSALALCAMAFATGTFHQSARQQVLDKNDLRLLPEEKFLPQSTWQCVVDNMPEFHARGNRSGLMRFNVQMEQWRVGQGEWVPARGRVAVRVHNSSRAGPKIVYGDRLEIAGRLTVAPRATNPGEFDRRKQLARQQIYYELEPRSWEVRRIGEAYGSWWWQTAYQLREWSAKQLRIGLEHDPLVSNLLSGMVIGDTHEIDRAVEQAFRRTNTYHIFAVSGQNVGLILMVGLVALKFTGALRWRWAWALAPALIFYCLMTGATPSSVRALVMALLVVAAWRLERPVSWLNLWSFAALAALVYDPLLIASMSFQLSFSVVLALILLAPPLYRVLHKPLEPDPFLVPSAIPRWRLGLQSATRSFMRLVAASLAAWIGSFLLLAYYFHQASLAGLLANLVVVPLAGIILVVGTLTLGVGLVSPLLAYMSNMVNWFLVKIMVTVVCWFAAWQWSSIPVPDWKIEWKPRVPEFIFLDTPGITSVLLRYKDRAWVINPGNSYSYSGILSPARHYYGVSRLTGVILTESGKAAAGSIELLRGDVAVEQWIGPQENEEIKRPGWIWKKGGREQGIEPLSAGQKLDFGEGLTVRVLAPDAQTGATTLADRGLVLLFEYAGKSLLWAGRVGYGIERKIMEQNPGIKADVVAQGYNEQDPNYETDWVERLNPSHFVECRGAVRHAVEIRKPALPRGRWWQVEQTGALRVKLAAEGIRLERLMLDRP